jgi:hypothetical protein
VKRISIREILPTLNLRFLKGYVNNVKLYRESSEVKNACEKYERDILVSYPHLSSTHFVNYDFRIDFNT